MGARSDNQPRQGDSQHSWTGVGSGANLLLALLLAKFVVAADCHCGVCLKPVVEAAHSRRVTQSWYGDLPLEWYQKSLRSRDVFIGSILHTLLP